MTLRRWHGVDGVARGRARWGAALSRHWWKILLIAIALAILALLIT